MTAPHPAAAPAQGEPVKHTAGPWILKDGSVFADRPNGECIALPYSRPGQCAAAQSHHWDEYEALAAEEHANARMCAAAPDLLAALQDVAAAGADDLMDGASPLWATVAAAIAKATGATR